MTRRTVDERVAEIAEKKSRLEEELERLENPLWPMWRRMMTAIEDARAELLTDEMSDDQRERHASIVQAQNILAAAIRGYRRPQ